jgi:hypothetical protein
MAFHAFQPGDTRRGFGDRLRAFAGGALPGDDLHEFVHRQAASVVAAPEVGSTWLVPEALSPKATVVSSPRNSEP